VAQDLTPELGGTLDTLGNNIAIGNGAGGYEGLLGNLDSGTGCFLSYAIDTTYNPTNGAIFLAPGEVHLSGSTVTLNSLEGTEARQVYCSAGGTLYSVVPPAAGWSVSDTDNGDYPLDTLAQWVKITGLEIATPEDLAANDPVDITVNIHIINNSSSRGGSIDIGVGINGAEPTTGGVNSVIAGDFDNLIPVNVSTAVAVERLTGTIFTVWIRRSSEDHNQFDPEVHGSTGATHSLTVGTPSETGAATAWGTITGTLSDQVDLQAALDDRYTEAETDNLIEQKRDKIAGIVGRGHSWLDFDFGTGELTLIPNAGTGQTEFTVWTYNVKYIKTNESIIIPKLVDEYIIYYDDTGELAYIDSTSSIETVIAENAAIIARISINIIDSLFTAVQDLRYDVHMSPSTRNTFVLTTGALYSSGLALTNINSDGTGDVDTDAQFSIEDGQIILADIVYETAGRQQVIAFPAEIPIFYKIGQTWKLKAADTFPVIYEGSVGADYAGTLLPYNLIDPATESGQLLSVPNNDLVCVHYFATPGLYDGIVGVQGQYTYTSKSNARIGAATEVGKILTNQTVRRYYTPIATVIFQSGNGKSNIPHAEIVSVNGEDEYIDLRLEKVALGAASSSEELSPVISNVKLHFMANS